MNSPYLYIFFDLMNILEMDNGLILW